MHIEASIERVRAFAAAQGWSSHRFAKEAGLAWHTVNNMRARDWSPTLRTLRKLEAVIPPQFTAAAQSDDEAPDAAFAE